MGNNGISGQIVLAACNSSLGMR